MTLHPESKITAAYIDTGSYNWYFRIIAGLIIANLVGLAFGSIPYIGPYVSVALSIILGYIGMHLTISKKAEIAGWFHFKAESGTKQKKKKVGKLLDTNIIIDGRILNIYQSGF